MLLTSPSLVITLNIKNVKFRKIHFTFLFRLLKLFNEFSHLNIKILSNIKFKFDRRWGLEPNSRPPYIRLSASIFIPTSYISHTFEIDI